MRQYFNPRLREGGDVPVASIYSFLPDQISIHASEKEATAVDSITLALKGDFNPRLREGGDIFLPKLSAVATISIHASEKEATQQNLIC